jgi:ATP-dependent DNA helicase RecQ
VPVADQERAHIVQAARRLFGYDALLPGQLETMACVLRGEDVLTILPTGGGKSLCYQLPAMLAERGVTLVISPLIALMKDQLDSLPNAVRPLATTLNSSLQGDELRSRLERVTAGAYRLVYAAPERLRQPPFLHALRRAGLNRLVVDEAHCVSLWGHDFRPDYFYIAQARQALGHPPLLALTATAPTRVRRDILHRLGDMRVVAGDVTRPNLRLEVLRAHADDKLGYSIICRKKAVASSTAIRAPVARNWRPSCASRVCRLTIITRGWPTGIGCRTNSWPGVCASSWRRWRSAWALTNPTFALSFTLSRRLRWKLTTRKPGEPGATASRLAAC